MPDRLTIDEALDLTRELLRAGRLADAAQVCEKLLHAVPDSAAALHLMALISYNQGKPRESIALLRRALREKPDAAEIWNDLGNLLQITHEVDEAIESYRRALELRNDYAEAHRNLASALRRLGRFDEAVTALETAVSLNPGFAEALAQLVYQLKQRCDWTRIDALTRQLIDAVSLNSAAVNPFVFLSLDTTPGQQLQCARQWSNAYFSDGSAKRTAARPPARDRRITVGYLSADFQEHATVHLIGELFLLHDRSRFCVNGYSYGRDDGSAARKRIAASFDSFVDLENASHIDAAARIRGDGVDILIDLKGYTTDARPQIVALRPAPIQVSYLGYPGTLGTDAVDYILSDRYVTPSDQQANFTEKLVRLPNCYQMNDRRRRISDRTPSRAECGLPDDRFVFCCLSASYKITASMFAIWMRLLNGVPGSVLWLLDSDRSATDNLRREAEAQLAGGAARLVFAPPLPNPEHLARLRAADLFLDTLPCNAHTLASDALWAGCPIITCAGATFASRVAGSILHAVGLADLATDTLADYEALALRLARERELLASVRARLQSNRLTAPLFDSRLSTRHIEAAFETMWRRYQAGEPPSAFDVAAADHLGARAGIEDG